MPRDPATKKVYYHNKATVARQHGFMALLTIDECNRAKARPCGDFPRTLWEELVDATGGVKPALLKRSPTLCWTLLNTFLIRFET